LAGAIRIRAVEFTSGARRQLGDLPADAHDACLEELRAQFEGEELQEADHVKALLIDDVVVRVNLFADKDGILWAESLSAG